MASAQAMLVFGVPLEALHVNEFDWMSDEEEPLVYDHGDTKNGQISSYLGFLAMGAPADQDPPSSDKLLEDLTWRPRLHKAWAAWHKEYRELYVHVGDEANILPAEPPEPQWYLLVDLLE